MSRWTTGLTAVAVGAILGLGRSAIAQAPTIAEQAGAGYHMFLTGKALMTVRDALQGAIRRLSRPACEGVFGEFSDQGGRALTANLASAGKSAAAVLADSYFVEADETVQCRGNEGVAAFTQPGSRVIHICSQRIVHFAAKTKVAEILLIHELLHTLGLGENPPTSSRITEAVLNRCG